jgi:hypothetical protein
MMANLQRRLTQLEARLTRDHGPLAWGDVCDAYARVAARASVKICRRLGIDASDPRVAEEMSRLVGDDEARIARDQALLARWRDQQGLPIDGEGARQRLAARLDAMARRLQDARSHPPRPWGQPPA